MLAFIGKQAGDRWESWKEHLHYIDYAVVAAIVDRRVWLFVRYRRRRGADPPPWMPPEIAAGRRPRTDPGRGRAAAGLLLRARRRGAAAAGLVGRGVGCRSGARSWRSRCTPARCWRWRRRCGALRPDGRTLALSLAPPVIVGLRARAADRGAARRAGRAGGGSAARRRRARRPRTGRRREPRAGAAASGRATRWRSGSAQAAALWPGVSRTGATLAAARALGYSPRGGLAALVRGRRARAGGRDGAEGLARPP